MYTLLCVLLLIASIMAILRPQDPRWPHLFLILLVVIPLNMLIPFALLELSGSPHQRYDQYFFKIDQLFGLPEWQLASLLNALPLLKKVVAFDYGHATCWTLLAVTLQLIVHGPRNGWRALITSALIGGLIPPFYRLLPASGPLYAFADYPYRLPQVVSPHVISLQAVPNCMPSAHMASALLVLYLAREIGIFRCLAWVHVGITILATLGLGEHYFIDLIAAVPYAAAIVILGHSITSESTWGAIGAWQNIVLPRPQRN